MAFSIIFVFLTYRDMKKELDIEIQNIADLQSEALALPLWNYFEDVKQILDTLTMNPDITMAVVRDTKGRIVALAGKPGESGTRKSEILIEREITFLGPDTKEKIIGYLSITFNRDRIYEILYGQLIRDSLLLLLLATAIIISALMANKLTIEIPLYRFLKTVRKTEEENVRDIVNWTARDELGQVIKAYNSLIESLKVAEKSLKLNMKKLEEDEAKYHALFEASNDAVLIMDMEEFIECNNQTLKIFGCTRKDIIGQSPLKFSPPTQPDGSLSQESAAKKINAAFHGEHQLFYWQHVRLDGSTFDAEVSLNPTRIANKAVVQAVVQDISERKRTEEALRDSDLRFRTFFEQGLIGMTMTSVEKGWIDANDVFCDMLGYSRNELFNMTWTEMTHPDDLESDLIQFRRLLAGEINGYTIEKRFIRSDNKIINTAVSINAILKADDNSVDYIIALAQDITERKQAEEKIKEYSKNLESMVEERTIELESAQEAMLNLVEDLNKSKDELENKALELEEMNIKIQEATEAKSRFLANMSHELRTPLNAIIGFSEILGDKTFGELNAKQTKYINNVLVSGRHLLQLINDILDLSKVETGKLELEPSRVNIKGLLENSLIIIKEKAMKHRVKLDLQISQELIDLEISADERKLKQIMFNLLSNAAKFTPDGGSIRLEANLISDFGFRISELEKEGRIISDQSAIRNLQSAIEISIADSGIGIKPEDQERVFGEFEQVDSTYARRQEGTGLGLALTRRLVRLHDGRIWVESNGEGKGSTFTFVIPIEAEKRKSETATEPEEPLSSRPDMVIDSLPLVLVVEDERQASELISHYLSEADYAVAHAFNGEQAIKMARELKPYAITLDIVLPKKDGWEVLTELKSLPETKDIPVIIVSITEDHQLGINLGAIEYFVKPVNKEQLIETVCKAGAVLGKEKITVLVVDDESQTVELLTDELQAEGFNVLQAYGGQQGIDLAIEKHPDVIILDLMMPEVSGFDVVQHLRAHSVAMKIPIMIFTAKDITEEDRQKLEGHVKLIASKSGSGKEDLLRALERLGRL